MLYFIRQKQNISYLTLIMDYIEQNQVQNEPVHFQKHKYLSYIFMILSCFTWVGGYIYCNQNDLNPIQSTIIRGFMIMLFSYAFCKWEGINMDLQTNRKQIFIRNIIFLLQAYIIAIVQFYLPLGVVHTLSMMGNIFIQIFQYIFEKHKPSRRQAIGMVLTFSGVIFTANGRIFSSLIDSSSEFTTDFSNYKSKDPKVMAIVAILFTMFYVLWGYAVYSTNKIKVSAHFINTLFGIKLYFFSSLLYVLLLKDGKNIDASTFYWGFAWSGIAFALSEAFFVLSIILASNIGVTIMLTAVGVLFAYFLSVYRYNQQLNMFCVIGSIFIVIGLSRIMLH